MTITETSMFLDAVLPPRSKLPRSKVKYRSFRISPGIITLGKPSLRDSGYSDLERTLSPEISKIHFNFNFSSEIQNKA